MFTHFRPALVLLVLFTLLTGIAYPLAMTGVAQAVLPASANGSLISINGKIVGSHLIGQAFASDRYFHGRPSAANNDASASTGSNLGPSSKVLLQQLEDRAASYGGKDVPADLVMASGSGLDPDISPAGALLQVARVAAARQLPADKVQALVVGHTQPPELAILGEPRVNVLDLNLALDQLTP